MRYMTMSLGALAERLGDEDMTKFEDFMKEALEPNASLRQGQKLMSMLSRHRSDLYERMLSSNDDSSGLSSRDLYDCFYDDSKIWGAIAWLRENWCASRTGRFTDQLEVEVTGGPTKCACGKPKITTVKQEGDSWRIGSWCGCVWGEEDSRLFRTRKEAEHALYEERSEHSRQHSFNSLKNRE